VRAPGAILQAMLQGILQGVGPVGCYKVLTGRFVTGSLFLGPYFGRFVLGVLLLDPLSWILIPGSFACCFAGRFVLG
jgi:hypothetical protein